MVTVCHHFEPWAAGVAPELPALISGGLTTPCPPRPSGRGSGSRAWLMHTDLARGSVSWVCSPGLGESAGPSSLYFAVQSSSVNGSCCCCRLSEEDFSTGNLWPLVLETSSLTRWPGDLACIQALNSWASRRIVSYPTVTLFTCRIVCKRSTYTTSSWKLLLREFHLVLYLLC